MRRRVVVSSMAVLSCAAMLVGPMASAQRHAAPTAVLALSADRTASAVVTVPAAIRSGHPFDGLSVTTKGSVAGFLISDLRGTPLLGRLVVRGVGLPADEALPLWFSDRDLRAGRYRITVITVAPAVVRIPWAAGRSQTMRIAGPAKVFMHFASSSTPSAGPLGAPVGRVEIPVPAGSYHLAALFDFMHATASQASADEQCISTTPTCAVGAGSGSQGWFLTPGNGGDDAGSAGTAFTPADVTDGSRAVFDDVDAGINAGYAALVLLFG